MTCEICNCDKCVVARGGCLGCRNKDERIRNLEAQLAGEKSFPAAQPYWLGTQPIPTAIPIRTPPPRITC